MASAETSVTIHQRLQDTKTQTLAHYRLADDLLDLRARANHGEHLLKQMR